MRLSNAKKLLLSLFLTTSLTLLIKPDAAAQSTTFPKVFAYVDYRNTPILLHESADEIGYGKADVPARDDVPALPPFDFLRTSESLCLKLPAHYASGNKAYKARPIIRTQLYSTCLGHSAHITFKLFKLIITPLRSK